MKHSPAEISQALRARRQQLGLSLSCLARRVGTSAATICRYEKGWDRFQLYTLRKLASALDCRLVIALQPLRPGGGQPNRQAAGAALKRLRRLFWDKSLSSADLRQYPEWVVRRVLELGNLADVRDLIGLLGREEVLRHAARLRFTSPKAERFWSGILEREGLGCTRRSSRTAAGISWLK